MSGVLAAPRRTRGLVAAIASVVVIALLVTGAVVAQGYDARKVNPSPASVWVIRDSGQYGRVNTELDQLDTVRDAVNPTAVAQDGSASAVFTEGFRKRWSIDPASPAALVDTASASGASPVAATAPSGETSPSGTRQVVSAGRWTAYLTESGKVFVAELGTRGSTAQPVQIDPNQQSGSSKLAYFANAIAVDDSGEVVMYSAREGAVRVYHAPTADFVGGRTVLRSAPSAAKLALTVVGGRWVLAQPGKNRVWLEGQSDPIRAQLGSDGVAENGTSTGDQAYFADSSGLLRISLGNGANARVTGGGGTPAAPTVVGGAVYAAWVGRSAGRLWSASHGARPLAVPDGTLASAQQIHPVIQSNGSSAVLNETGSGLLWTVPDGTSIPLSQWSVDNTKTTQNTGTTRVQDVAEEEPPVARPDSFGVRPGHITTLPVLLNDYDPNAKDIVTVDPKSISGGLSVSGFGAISLADNDQQIVVDVSAHFGSATFSYAVTDGQKSSAPTTVTLNIVPEVQNGAPVWCGVADCLQVWPTVALAPGGTVTVPVLTGWVDPEGDQIALQSAVADDPRTPLTVVPTADGRIAIRHTDPNAGGGTYPVTVTVVDARGATASKILEVVVAGAAALSAGSITAVAGVGQPVNVPIEQHVTGGSGSYRIVDAVLFSGDRNSLTVTPNAAAGTIELTARQSGQYVITYTVEDAQTRDQQSADVRLSVSDSARALSMSPIAAFVRAQQDTTLDVLQAVQNTTNRVLAVTAASTSDPGLSVSVVGGSRLRLSGSTVNGQPGVVGTALVTVSDGAGSTAVGQVTVFLVGATTGVAPIAIPDAVTVRAGTQIDVPVTANDIAPRGEQLVLSPAVQGSGAPHELVFTAGNQLRYLAPDKAGIFTLHYSVSLAADPERVSTAAVTVTVVAQGSDHAPVPPALTGRVALGQSVTIRVPTGSSDPDGDATQISAVSQPARGQGTTQIRPDGTSIVYTAPTSTVSAGQVAFEYTLTDPSGEIGTGQVQVAVFSASALDVTPVTYAADVRVVRGAPDPVTVAPLLQDSDPAGGTLSLVSLVPNVPKVPGDPEYGRLMSLIDPRTSLKSGDVKLLAGTVEGVHSYIYTVRSSVTSSSAQGLIVVTVTASATVDVPVISDTVLGLGTRPQLADGIDVISGKTLWSSGNIDTLKLTIWGDAATRYHVVGRQISGPAPVGGALVPFELKGLGASGQPVRSFGFLRIPAFDDMRVQLADSITPRQVGEEQSANLHLETLVAIGAGDRLEVRGGGDPVQRSNASCTSSATDAVYDAGREAPWVDSCTVQVRIAGQHTWTPLPIPLVIQPKAPQAILTSVSRSVAPGESQTIDLYRDMTSWEGGRVGSLTALDYHVTFNGSDFAVTTSGAVVTVIARADAHPGARDSGTVTVTGFGGLTANIGLIVGVAPADAPRGATFTQTCSVARSGSCVAPVVGIPGEYDPFAAKAGSGLKLVGIAPTSCAVATITTSGTTAISAIWPSSAKPAGGSCIVPYTVADAQGRTGSGTLSFDIQGYPSAPSSITTTAYTGTSLTFLVTLGDAAVAHPAVTGIALYQDGAGVSSVCTSAATGTFSCMIGGLVNGQHHQFTARAVNAVGESTDTTPVSAWAYEAPVIGGVTADGQTYLPGQQSTSQGIATLSIQSSPDTSALLISPDSAGQRTVARAGSTTTTTVSLSPGAHTVTVTPISQFQPPIGTGSSGQSSSVQVQVAGVTVLHAGGQLVPTSNTTMRFQDFSADANFGTFGVTVLYAIWQGDARKAPQCSMGSDGHPVLSGGQASADFTGLQTYQNYSAIACATNGFGTAQSVQSGIAWTVTPGPTGTLSYTVATAPSFQTTKVGGANYTSSADYGMASGPTVTTDGKASAFFHLYVNGYTESSFTLRPDRVPDSPSVESCFQQGFQCSQPSSISATTAPTIVHVSVESSCIAVPAPKDVVVSAGVGGSDYAVTPSTATSTSGTTTISYTVTFSGAFGSLAPTTLTRCFSPPPPSPTPPPPSPTPPPASPTP